MIHKESSCSEKSLRGAIPLSVLLFITLMAVIAPRAVAAVTPRIAAGTSFSIGLKNDGTVWTWGYNAIGQLGNGTTTNQAMPGQVSTLTAITAIAAGDTHAVALESGGAVLTWGDNTYAQLGFGTTGGYSHTPYVVSGVTAVTAIAAGSQHTVVVKSDGTVWTWGSNSSGQLGNGSSFSRSSPVQVTGLTNVKEVAAGESHTVAVKNDGTVWTWGANSYGQLGDGTTLRKTTPVQVTGLTGIITVAAGAAHTIALKNDGTVWGWGNNASGQLGENNTTATTRITPIQIAGLTAGMMVAAHGNHSVLLTNDGTVRTWGANTFGQIGDGGTSNRFSPTVVSGLSGAIAVAAGADHTLVMKSDNSVWSWGAAVYGQLGDAPVPLPVPVVGLNKITAITGNEHILALSGDGTLWSWGNNNYGQLGDGTITNRTSPLQVTALSLITAAAAGGRHSVALSSDGSIWTWGANSSGQLGDGGATTVRATAAQVAGLTGGIAVAAGGSHTVAVTNDGTVRSWGNNASGQLGDGTTNSSAIPVTVYGLTGVKAVAAGSAHTVALMNDGTVWSWGDNTSGQLGIGSTSSRATPVQVTGLTNVKAISAGDTHTVAVKDDGTVWAWGANISGQLGDGSTNNRTTPVQVSGLTSVTAVVAGLGHTLALKNDGSVWGWGSSDYGQLGGAAMTVKTVPIAINGLSRTLALSTGGYAVRIDGSVWVWGSSGYHQLETNPVQTRISLNAMGVTSFVMPAYSAALSVPITGFTANSATEYCVTTTATNVGCVWSSSIPTQYVVTSDGIYTFRAWVRDQNGVVSLPVTAAVTVDATPPKVTIPTTPFTSNSLTVSISGLTATDTFAVPYYCVTLTESSAGCVWGSKQASFNVSAPGSYAIFAWAKDIVGNISAPVNSSVIVDTDIPVITSFSMANSRTLTFPVTELTANDATGITNWCLTTATDSNSCNWTSTNPTSYTVSSPNALTISAFVRDIVGHVSARATANVQIDVTPPVVTSFDLLVMQDRFVVPIAAFTATDNDRIDGYLVTMSQTPPAADDSGWLASPPTTFTLPATNQDSAVTLYAWAKDQAGNVSSALSAIIDVPVCGITASAGNGGAISGAGTTAMVCGSNRLYHIEPKPGYRVVSLLVDGVAAPAENDYLFTSVTQTEHTIVADFERDPFANWHKVAPGGTHTLAVRADGTLWGWGANGSSQLGASSDNRLDPVRVGSSSFWEDVAAGPTWSSGTTRDGVKDSTKYGILWGWGDNQYGQLGNGATANLINPTRINDGPWAVIDSGSTFGAGITTTGTLWMWGFPPGGAPQSSITPVGSDANWVKLAAGALHTLAIKADGTLWAWGDNGNGQLGDDSVIFRTEPVRIGTGASWVRIAAGKSHSVALESNGNLWVWGSNNSGQLGTDQMSFSVKPYRIGAGHIWKAIAAGDNHTLALRADGTLWAFGENIHGELGDGSGVAKNYFTQVGLATEWKSIHAGGSTSFGIKTDNTLWAWGANGAGQLGDLTLVDKLTPVLVGTNLTSYVINAVAGAGGSISPSGSVSVVSGGTATFTITPLDGWRIGNVQVDGVSAGQPPPLSVTFSNVVSTHRLEATFVDNAKVCSIHASAGNGGAISGAGTTAMVCGSNRLYHIEPKPGYRIASLLIDGQSAPLTNDYLFTSVTQTEHTIVAGFEPDPSANWHKVAPGGLHTLAVRADGTLWGWGANGSSQLGAGVDSRLSPVRVGSLSVWEDVAAGPTWSSARAKDVVIGSTKDGFLWGWGDNQYGQLGNGATANLINPTRIDNGPWAVIDSGSTFGAGITTTGMLSMWGFPPGGTAPTPITQVGIDANWVKLAAGALHTLAIKADGTLWAWGDNSNGQLGDGSVIFRAAPVRIGAGASWVRIAAGRSHSVALESNGNLWVWGSNNTGQLGTDQMSFSVIPYQVGGGGQVWKDIAAGDNHTLALRADGTLWAFGENTHGELGDGSGFAKNYFTQVGLVNEWKSIRAGGSTSFGIKTDNTLWAWGANGAGQLGDSTLMDKLTPVQVGTNLTSYVINAVAGVGGSISPSGSVSVVAGGTETFTITPLDGWRIDNVLKDGVSQGQPPPSSVTFSNVVATHRLEVTFVDNAKVCTIHASAGTGGTISDVGTIAIACGSNRLYHIEPKPGYRVVSLVVDGLAVQAENDYLFTAVTQTAHTIVAGFELDPFANWHAVAPGGAHTLAVRADGTLWGWGSNGSSQLGSISDSRLNPVRIGSLSIWEDVAAGPTWSSGRTKDVVKESTKDGFLWGWGDNRYGQLGNGATTNLINPTRIDDGPWAVIDSGSTYGAGITTTGTLSMWGFPPGGTAPTPITQVGSGANWLKLASGASHTLAIKADGTLWAWGDNSYGQLGDGSVIFRAEPVRIGSGARWVRIAAGMSHSVALESNGNLWVWGNNSTGQLGTDQISFSLIPYQVEAGKVWKAIAAGDNHTLALRADGTLWAFGENARGELGDGSGIAKNYFTRVGLATDWKSIRAGGSTSFGIKTDNNLWAWGANGSGQLGDATLVDKLTPTLIGTNLNSYFINAVAGEGGSISPSGSVAIAAGGTATFTITPLVGWRIDNVLVDGVSVGQPPPSSITFNNVVNTHRLEATFADIVHSYRISFALPSIWWSATVPVTTLAGIDFTGITEWCLTTATQSSACNWTATKPTTYTVSGGGLWTISAFAKDAAGNVSIRATAEILVDLTPPVVTSFDLLPMTDDFIVPIAAFTATDNDRVAGYLVTMSPTPPAANDPGWSASRPLTFTLPPATQDGVVTLYAWAKDQGGNVSSARTATVTVKVCTINAVAGTGGAISDAGTTAIVCGVNRLYHIEPKPGFRIASLVVDGKSVSPANDYLFTAVTTTGHTISAGFEPDPLANWHKVAPGGTHTLAVRADGTLWAWGAGIAGQLETGGSSLIPVRVGTSSHWEDVAAKPTWFSARTSDGALWAWGGNQYGQLGTGSTANFINPTLIDVGPWSVIASGDSYGGGITTTGALMMWGLSPGAATPSPITQVGSDVNWLKLATGASHTLAIKADGTLWAWGDNSSGQLGDGTTLFRNQPVRIGAGASWVQIAVGKSHSVALENNGNLWVWGYNGFGQLGTDRIPSSTVPYQVGGAHIWKAIAAGDNHTLALRTDSSLWAFGENTHGELGDGTLLSKNRFSQVGATADWKSIRADGSTSFGIKIDNSLWAWGLNDGGQLGDLTKLNKESPVLVGTSIDSYVINAVAGVGGNISPSGSITFPVGSTATFNISPLVGWRINDVIVDGIPMGIQSSVLFENVTDIHRVEATFVEIQNPRPNIIAIAGTGGSISPAGFIEVENGASQRFVMGVQPGYQIVDVLIDGVSQGAYTSYSFTDIRVSHTIVLVTGQTTATPVGFVLLNNAAQFATTTAVVATQAIPQAAMMRFSWDNSTWESWITYTVTRDVTLPAGDGAKTLFVQFKNDKEDTSVTYSDSIVLDTIPPTAGVFVGNGASISTLSVTATITASDTGSGVSQMQWKWDNDSWSIWESYVPSKTVNVPVGNGIKTLYLRVRDLAGNISNIASDTIDLVLPIDGLCGSAAGKTSLTVPEVNLCTTGPASPITGTGPWQWNCLGQHGGTDVTCTAMIQQFTLYISRFGDGGGNILTDSGMTCFNGADCQFVFNYNTLLNLFQTPNSISLFRGWSGCTPTSAGACQVTMNTDRNVVATFTAAAKVLLGVIPYPNLQAAYDVAADNAVIRLLLDTNVGALKANRAITVTLSGGYNAEYTSQVGVTTLQSQMSLNKGAILFDRVIVK